MLQEIISCFLAPLCLALAVASAGAEISQEDPRKMRMHLTESDTLMISRAAPAGSGIPAWRSVDPFARPL